MGAMRYAHVVFDLGGIWGGDGVPCRAAEIVAVLDALRAGIFMAR
jgi:hypothetical protein